MSDFYDAVRGPGRPPKYPFRRMEVGDVVTLPGQTARRIGKRVCDYKPMKFKCKAIMRGGIVGVRVERVA